MGQNVAAQTALVPGGGVGFLNLDAEGNLRVAVGLSDPAQHVFGDSGNVANAAAVATLPAVAGKTNALAGLLLAFTGATAASVVLATVTGLKGGTMTVPVAVPAGAAVGGVPVSLTFNPPIPASAQNVAIVVTLPALGSGNTDAAAAAWGLVA